MHQSLAPKGPSPVPRSRTSSLACWRIPTDSVPWNPTVPCSRASGPAFFLGFLVHWTPQRTPPALTKPRTAEAPFSALSKYILVATNRRHFRPPKSCLSRLYGLYFSPNSGLPLTRHLLASTSRILAFNFANIHSKQALKRAPCFIFLREGRLNEGGE